ncbi:MAG: DNA translocase FtsK 4TM domain-containing protein [Deltaproteobacteria bacterium]|nr:DNA translocase FtsK 4TM domain-containing protein [Deltaproteobacteria bacterium]
MSARAQTKTRTIRQSGKDRSRSRQGTAAKKSTKTDLQRHELAGTALLATALLAGSSLLSVQFGTGTLMGPAGRTVAVALYAVMGTASHLLVAAMLLYALRLMLGEQSHGGWTMWTGYLGAVTMAAVIFDSAYPGYRVYGFGAGGRVGQVLGTILHPLFSSAGTYFIASVGLVLFLMLATKISIVEAAVFAGRMVKKGWLATLRLWTAIWPVLKTTFTWKPDPIEGDLVEQTPPKMAIPTSEPIQAAEPISEDPVVIQEPVATATDETMTLAPTIVERAKKVVEKAVPQEKAPKQGPYELPTLDMLADPPTEQDDMDRESMFRLAQHLEMTLKDYGIKGSVRQIHPGPVVTLYEFKPERGTKVSKIASLSSDLAMVMEATKVRIVAPIPGKAAVGIEIPNKARQTVFLRELLEDPTFYKGHPQLRLALGKDISGTTRSCDLGKAPHLLIAGATGAGKSVGVHAMILSLLYQFRPHELKLLLIDPKMLEFAPYHDLPHLLHPVVTDPKKANLALRWAVEEMETRYQKLAEMGVRDILSYNAKITRLKAEQAPDEAEESAEDERDDEDVERFDPSAEEPTHATETEASLEIDEADPLDAADFDENDEVPDISDIPEPLPYIVIIIDEFADLMMAAPKEVETSVTRIAQKARAAGIHLMVATQRPSTDVITGLIKANFPTRIAYQVSSKTDSRVVLDQHGAEALLGRGDMLFSDRGLDPDRVHGPFVSEEEIAAVAEFLKKQGRPEYVPNVLEPKDGNTDQNEDRKFDAEYDRAVALVTSAGRASTTMLQSRMSLGYAHAARIIDQMEREGVIGPPQGSKGRKILVQSMDF